MMKRKVVRIHNDDEDNEILTVQSLCNEDRMVSYNGLNDANDPEISDESDSDVDDEVNKGQ